MKTMSVDAAVYGRCYFLHGQGLLHQRRSIIVVRTMDHKLRKSITSMPICLSSLFGVWPVCNIRHISLSLLVLRRRRIENEVSVGGWCTIFN